MFYILISILIIFVCVGGYWCFFSTYIPPHFKGRHKFSDFDDAMKCLWTFGYYNSSLAIEQKLVEKFVVIIKYHDHENDGLELLIPTDHWTDKDNVWFLVCKTDIDIAITLSKYLSIDLLKMNVEDHFDYNFNGLSVYGEFPKLLTTLQAGSTKDIMQLVKSFTSLSSLGQRGETSTL